MDLFENDEGRLVAQHDSSEYGEGSMSLVKKSEVIEIEKSLINGGGYNLETRQLQWPFCESFIEAIDYADSHGHITMSAVCSAGGMQEVIDELKDFMAKYKSDEDFILRIS